MSFDEKSLYELLPAIYRIRDAEQGEPLKALLKVIAEQAAGLEENLAQLYDDQFAETCAPWVLPYIGELIGITGLPGTSLQALSPRAEVAHTIAYRRGKGTAATLEQLARDVSGWPARAVEFFQLLATAQYLNHLRPENQSFVNVRDAGRLEYLGGAFEHAPASGAEDASSSAPPQSYRSSLRTKADLTHTVDVRRIARGHGRYNIPNVGLFLWRLRAFSLTRSPAVPASPGDRRRFLFSPLGIDLPLFNLPLTEEEMAHLAEPINVPDRIKRRTLHRSLNDYYGRGKSLLLELANADINFEPAEIPPTEVIVCNLTDWTNMPADKIAIDPVLGRIAFPQDQTVQVLVTFHYGFSANMGGGEYNRLSSSDTSRTEVLDASGQPVLNRVSNTFFKDAAAQNVHFQTINDALSQLGAKGGTVEIVNSGRYEENLTLDATGKRIELRAADKRRPTLVLSGDLQVSGGADDEVILDGLLVVGGALRVSGRLGRLRLRHCTFVPGIALYADGSPAQPNAPSLVVDAANTRVEIDHCIVGGIVAAADVEVRINDSIVDATDERNPAYAGTSRFGGQLRITNSTVIGLVRAGLMRLASNTIFLATSPDAADGETPLPPVLVERRQEGCARFSYLSPKARVPTRFHCQPEPDDSLVRPRLVSSRFRDPEYCQLGACCPPEIRRGADDEGSMGAFHDLLEPQREAHLRARVEEYLRFGLEAGIFYAT